LPAKLAGEFTNFRGQARLLDRALQQNAYCYVHATEVGGTHPALLEALGYGNCVLTLATSENLEVVGEAGIPYADERDLTDILQRVLRDASLVSAYRQRAQARIREHYDWEHVVNLYENLFARMARQPAPHVVDFNIERPESKAASAARR